MEIVPKFYNGQVDCITSPDYIAIEFLSDYRLTDDTVFLSNDHIEMVLQKLGYFHGMNYVIKETDCRQFEMFRKQFVETRFKKFSFDRRRMLFEWYINAAMMRGFRYVPNLNRFSGKIIDMLQKKFQDPHNMCCDLIQPKNDIAVLCHGDFNRNNLMFKYTDNNKLKSLKIIDFQTVRYASPATDLSLFLSMNVNYQLLEQNFERFFKIYHNAIMQTIKKHSPKTDLRKYSLEAFLKDYAEHAIYGYHIIVFFMEIMDDPQSDFTRDPEYMKCDTIEEMQTQMSKKYVYDERGIYRLYNSTSRFG
ncbi:uncharacterized protein LOC123302988 [Chrysoperla carnea]|uniref:uncharacterized protein LOC123302988 n=1 Tax=Chrysoperla carnea TaxID=189513 RepID=UPI001D069A8D|nr:uncharacterized protein LOC123302988 [Chrysoperla carnea]